MHGLSSDFQAKFNKNTVSDNQCSVAVGQVQHGQAGGQVQHGEYIM